MISIARPALTDTAQDLERKCIALFECIKSCQSVALSCGLTTHDKLLYDMSAEELAFVEMSPKQRLFYGLWKQHWTLPKLDIENTRHPTLASPQVKKLLASYADASNRLYRRNDFGVKHATFFEQHCHYLMPLISAMTKVTAYEDIMEELGIDSHRDSPIHPLHKAEISALPKIIDALIKAQAMRRADKMQRQLVRVAKNVLLERLDALQHLEHYLNIGTHLSNPSDMRSVSIIPFSVIAEAVHNEDDLSDTEDLPEGPVPAFESDESNPISFPSLSSQVKAVHNEDDLDDTDNLAEEPVPALDSDESNSVSSSSPNIQDDPFSDIWEHAKLNCRY